MNLESFSRGSGGTPGTQGFNDLFSAVYEELLQIASRAKRGQISPALNSTALVHELWLKWQDSGVSGCQSVFHFKAIAATAMRQILVDEARRRKAAKRGGDPLFLTLDAIGAKPIACEAELLDLNDALNELASLNARQAEIVEKRFFAGMTVGEISRAFDLSESTVEKNWRIARAWLGAKLIAPAK